MNKSSFCHIHLPITDDDVRLLEKFLGIKVTWVEPIMVPRDKIDVFPMSPPSSKIDFLEIKHEH
jgi:hypothetical protein